MISVVITNLNNYEETWFTTQAVLNELREYEYEIIIADNGSEKGELDLLKEMVENFSKNTNIKLVIWDKRKSCPGIRTAGIIEAKYDLICFMDGHVVPAKNYFNDTIPLFDDPDVYVVFAPERYYSQSLYEYTMEHQTRFQQSTATFDPISEEPYPVAAACQDCTMIRKDFLKLFFPEDELNYVPYTMDEPNTPFLAWMFGKKVLMNTKTFYAHRPWAYTRDGNCDYGAWRPLGAYALAGKEMHDKAREFWHSVEEFKLPQKHRDFIEKNAKIKFKDIEEYLIAQGVKR